MMSTDLRGTGRLIGVLTLLQMIGGGVTNFVLLAFPAPGFLPHAAPHALQVGAAVLLGLATGAVNAGIAIAASTVFRQFSRIVALWFVVLATVSFALTAVEAAGNLSLLFASQAYTAADAADRHLFEALRPVISAGRNGAHYVTVFVGGGMIFALYAALFRFALIPRALAAFGLFAAAMQLMAIAMVIFGGEILFVLLLPLALSQLALALWLIAKGFVEHSASPPLAAEARS
jgi:hypothetical protein